jgi:SH3-like domain-containing protein
VEQDTRAKIKTNPAVRLVRWIVPWILLGGVLYVVWGATSDFRDGRLDAPAQTTTTVEATSTPVAGVTGTILIDGVHLRDYPAAGGSVLKDLKKDATFDVLEQRADWLRVKDAAGNIGWITADPKFVTTNRQ